jgi:hypothetical protein
MPVILFAVYCIKRLLTCVQVQQELEQARVEFDKVLNALLSPLSLSLSLSVASLPFCLFNAPQIQIAASSILRATNAKVLLC